MICVVITGPTLQEIKEQMREAQKRADLVELRLDLFEDVSINALKQLREKFSIPFLLTPKGNDLQFASLQPEYLDIDHGVDKSLFEKDYPNTQVICSYHNFSETPEDLEALFQRMQRLPASLYKIATRANNATDLLRMLHLIKRHPKKLIGISMGEQGVASRILGPILGSPITYACLDAAHPTAPGQLDVQTLTERYCLDADTDIYGLIGDPVDSSIGDVWHNHFFRKEKRPAVYVKIPVTPEVLGPFLQLARTLPIKGLSVTMPLKECIIPYLDAIDPEAAEIGAVNTLCFEGGKITGYNTDCFGALDALEKKGPVRGKRVVLLGAGGAAKAIAYEARKRGALVTLLNRSESRGSGMRCTYGRLKDLKQHPHDILINCTPVPMPIKEEEICRGAHVMDINARPKETLFLQHAKKRGCQITYGEEMFALQAEGQRALWMKFYE